MDCHVVKMILEYGQLLSGCGHLMGIAPEAIPYKLTHKRHPCTLWVCESSANYRWLFKLLFYLHKEYEFRYNKIHSSAKYLPKFQRLQSLLLDVQPRIGQTPFPQAMPDFCKARDSINAYRNLYVNVKSRMKRAGWRKAREFPRWYGNYRGVSVKYGQWFLSPDSYILEDLGIRDNERSCFDTGPLFDSIGKLLEA